MQRVIDAINAAHDLEQTTNRSGIFVADVCARAGVSTSTLYLRFDGLVPIWDLVDELRSLGETSR